jgi:hypothetical protein
VFLPHTTRITRSRYAWRHGQTDTQTQSERQSIDQRQAGIRCYLRAKTFQIEFFFLERFDNDSLKSLAIKGL